MGKIEAVTGAKRSFADKAISTKLQNLRNNAEYTHFLYDKAFASVKDLFGGRVRFMVTGSAPLNRDVIDFLKIAGCCPIYEGYGLTESTGGSFLTYDWDPHSGHVGGPATSTEAKLIDVPEMNYLSTDVDEQGRSTPRGEVCLRGAGIFAGYYKDEERTKEALDEEGWLHTGDVGMFGLGGNLKIIDRRKNIFKLSQGEYIAPEKIEGVYLKVRGVAEIFVYGDSL
jgi:long-chain acyl-CoA synthetase